MPDAAANLGDYQTPQRMALKVQALPPLDFTGKAVLDVGCDHGFWSFKAARAGAARVVGLDRGRDVRGKGFTNLVAQNEAIARSEPDLGACSFRRVDLGKQWHHFGRFDLILLMSVYHHIFQNCGDHRAIWFWLWRHCAADAALIFEGPEDDADPVVRANVDDGKRPAFTRSATDEAAGRYFVKDFSGPALHESTRIVHRLRPLRRPAHTLRGVPVAGAGGASKAFHYADDRRIGELTQILGFRPFPGSLNLKLDRQFDWDRGYVRAQLLDVRVRSQGLDSEWAPRWARFYPVILDGSVSAWAFRFEGETYAGHFMELIAPVRLRDSLAGPDVEIAC